MLALTLRVPDFDPGLLGEQVGPPRGHLSELVRAHGLLGLGEAAPAGTTPGDTGDPGYEHPVTVSSLTTLIHSVIIEYVSYKCK